MLPAFYEKNYLPIISGVALLFIIHLSLFLKNVAWYPRHYINGGIGLISLGIVGYIFYQLAYQPVFRSTAEKIYLKTIWYIYVGLMVTGLFFLRDFYNALA